MTATLHDYPPPPLLTPLLILPYQPYHMLCVTCVTCMPYSLPHELFSICAFFQVYHVCVCVSCVCLPNEVSRPKTLITGRKHSQSSADWRQRCCCCCCSQRRLRRRCSCSCCWCAWLMLSGSYMYICMCVCVYYDFWFHVLITRISS